MKSAQEARMILEIFLGGCYQRWRDYKLPCDYRSFT